jgi:LPPG:FO 2-phospho-L-lactate transferase
VSTTGARAAAQAGRKVRRVVELAGGVGGARLAAGFQAIVGQDLSVIVNTGDDLERHGLLIWPDVDTVLYTLAGLEDPERGWGLRDETWSAMGQLDRYGEPTWFRLGDRDLATHLLRTEHLRRGERPTEVASLLAERLGVRARVMPMSDAPVRTMVRSGEDWLEFQEYFVARGQAPTVDEVRFDGTDLAGPGSEMLAAIEAASAIVIGPSNPIVSIGPILALAGMEDSLLAARERGVPVVAVSPIVAGRALKGPADRMLASLGHEPSALGVARLYRDLADGFVVDRQDAALVLPIERLGLAVLSTDTIMVDAATRSALAGEILGFAGRLVGHPASAGSRRRRARVATSS